MSTVRINGMDDQNHPQSIYTPCFGNQIYHSVINAWMQVPHGATPAIRTCYLLLRLGLQKLTKAMWNVPTDPPSPRQRYDWGCLGCPHMGGCGQSENEDRPSSLGLLWGSEHQWTIFDFAQTSYYLPSRVTQQIFQTCSTTNSIKFPPNPPGPVSHGAHSGRDGFPHLPRLRRYPWRRLCGVDQRLGVSHLEGRHGPPGLPFGAALWRGLASGVDLNAGKGIMGSHSSTSI